MKTKKCKGEDCQKVLSIDNFLKVKNNVSGTHNFCHKCRRKMANKAYRDREKLDFWNINEDAIYC